MKERVGDEHWLLSIFPCTVYSEPHESFQGKKKKSKTNEQTDKKQSKKNPKENSKYQNQQQQKNPQNRKKPPKCMR